MIAGYEPDFWHWWILGLALIIAETLLPGTYFLWMGVSAVVLGVLAWLFPAMGWEIQLMLFALLSLASIVVWRMWQRRHPGESDQPMLNRRAEQYIGRVFVLEAAIENGFGKVRVADSLWRVKGADAPVGSRVRVTAADGIVLVVEPAD
ncbi:MAG: NfeD family protein [Sedimenticolaceae bacterium]